MKSMSFNGTEGTFITLSQGSTLTATYRSNFLTGGKQNKAIFFGKEKLLELLGQTNCVGIRFYFGAATVDRSGQPVTELTLVAVGASSDENDQLGTNDKILDEGSPCPMLCSTSNPLNS